MFKMNNHKVCHPEERRITHETLQRLAIWIVEILLWSFVPQDDKNKNDNPFKSALSRKRISKIRVLFLASKFFGSKIGYRKNNQLLI